MSGTLKLAGYILTSVPCLQLNHYHNKNGKHVFSQTIVMEQDPRTGKLHTRAWLLADDDAPDRRPTRNEVTGRWELDWYDVDNKVTRKITTGVLHESWTQKDPEMAVRSILNEKYRHALPNPLPKEE